METFQNVHEFHGVPPSTLKTETRLKGMETKGRRSNDPILCPATLKTETRLKGMETFPAPMALGGHVLEL